MYIYSMIIGTITQNQRLKSIRKGNRDAELELTIGWSSKHKVHKSDKQYTRKLKHKNY